jgi:glycosyltransferase involved in cell wall biosynthesis
MATIGIDARVLMTENAAGVWMYTKHLITHVTQHGATRHRFVLFFNASQGSVPDFIESLPGDVSIVRTKIPNKLLRLLWHSGTGPRFEDICRERIDCIISPHISVIQTNAPVITVIHDLTYERFPHLLSSTSRRWHTFVSRFSKAHSQAFIAVSQTTKRDLLKIWRLPSSQIRVIYPGLKQADDRGDGGLDSSARRYGIDNEYLLFVGTLEKRKNVEFLIEVFSRLDNNNLSLVLAGSTGNACNAISALIRQRGLTHRVKVIGYVSEHDKYELLRKASIFVYPSFYEGFGFPPLEAMLQGTPVVCSREGSLKEIVGDAARLVDPYDVEETVAALQTLLDSPAACEDLRRKGFKQVQRYSWDACAQSMLAFVEDICHREQARTVIADQNNNHYTSAVTAR